MFKFLAVLLFGFSAWAMGPSQFPSQSQMFLSTEEVSTPAGPGHLEVQSFSIENEQDVDRVVGELLEKTRRDNKTNSMFVLDVRDKNYKPTKLETFARTGMARIDSSIVAGSRELPKPVVVEAPKKGIFKKHYNLTLAFVRFVANSATVTTGLVMGRGVSMEHALLIGALAGSLSAAVQIKSDAVFKWLSNSVLMVNAAKKIGLLPKSEGDPRAEEKVLKQVEMYGRWAMLEAGFLMACRTAMSLLNIPVAENLFLTVAKSTGSQGVYEIGVLKATALLEKMNPNWTAKAAVFKNVSLFAGSGVSVLAAIGSMVGMPYANLGFVVLTGAGIVLNFSSKIVALKPVEQILKRWKLIQAIRCEMLFE